jgi:hypothetical protein
VIWPPFVNKPIYARWVFSVFADGRGRKIATDCALSRMLLDSRGQATYNRFYRKKRFIETGALFSIKACVTWRDAYSQQLQPELRPLPIDVRLAIMRGLKNVI